MTGGNRHNGEKDNTHGGTTHNGENKNDRRFLRAYHDTKKNDGIRSSGNSRDAPKFDDANRTRGRRRHDDRLFVSCYNIPARRA
jgi:hypothetical protein